MIPALIVYGIGGLVSGFASLISREPYPWILWGRIIQGFGAAGTSPIAMALVSDTFSTTEKSKALGIMEASNGVGKVVSPVLGSLIAMIIWYLIFFTYSFLTIPIGVMIWFIIKEERSHGERKNLKIYFGEIFAILKAKGLSLILCLAGGFLTLFILYGILANISDIIGGELKRNVLKRGFIVALPVMTMSIVAYWSGAYLKNKETLYKKLVAGSLTACVVCLLVMPFLKMLLYRLIVLEAIGIAVGAALTALNIFVTSCAPPGKRGVVTAVYNSFRFLGIALGPVFFTSFYKSALKPGALTAMAGGLALFIHMYLQSDLMLEYFGVKKLR
ncbi:Bacillibactin exporter [Thermotalea metallivorans]|uniref:Bacillibactin exporter n=1 Tax=Thermotalea metallivorans TaxID=520762 RepID=A0A140L1J0_9FIRM|nr:Bacillibactin exporter [Thermotalea metallivorans]